MKTDLKNAELFLMDKLEVEVLPKSRIILGAFEVAEWMEEYAQSSHVTKDVLGLDNPWPLKDVLKTLVDASDELLHRYNYDKHGHEEIQKCVNRGKEIIEELSSPQHDQGKETIYDIEFGLDCKAGISVQNNILHVIGAMNGYGNSIKDVKITVVDSPAKPDIKQQ